MERQKRYYYKLLNALRVDVIGIMLQNRFIPQIFVIFLTLLKDISFYVLCLFIYLFIVILNLTVQYSRSLGISFFILYIRCSETKCEINSIIFRERHKVSFIQNSFKISSFFNAKNVEFCVYFKLTSRVYTSVQFFKQFIFAKHLK